VVGVDGVADGRISPSDEPVMARVHPCLRELAGALAGVRVMVMDETRNESGSHKQRAARAVVHAAAADGYHLVVVGTCGNYGLAIAVEARRAGMVATVVMPGDWGEPQHDRLMRALGARISHVDGGYEDAVAWSKVMAADGMIADGNVNGPYAHHVIQSLSGIAREIIGALGAAPTAVWVPLGNGTTVSAVGSVPAVAATATVVGVTSQGSNSILASWPGKLHAPLKPGSVTTTRIREPLVNWAALHGQECLDVLHGGAGLVVGVTDEQLIAAQRLLRDHGVVASPAGAAGIAGLQAHASRSPLGGTHVAVVTGR
jgi:threonine synthase